MDVAVGGEIIGVRLRYMARLGEPGQNLECGMQTNSLLIHPTLTSKLEINGVEVKSNITQTLQLLTKNVAAEQFH